MKNQGIKFGQPQIIENYNIRTCYEVVWAGSLRALSEMVTVKLNEGWNCQGGIYVYDSTNYYQAITKMEVVDLELKSDA